MPPAEMYTYAYAPLPLAQLLVQILFAPISSASPIDLVVVPDLDDPRE